MNTTEARVILENQLRRYRSFSYSELVRLLDQTLTAEIRGESGVDYQLEIDVLWDGRPNGNVRVLGSIDDGGWRAFVPLVDSFVMAPDGSFVGE